MNLLTPSTQPSRLPSATRSLERVDRKNIGYLRLLSKMLDEPVDSLVHQLRAEIPIVEGLAPGKRDSAA